MIVVVFFFVCECPRPWEKIHSRHNSTFKSKALPAVPPSRGGFKQFSVCLSVCLLSVCLSVCQSACLLNAAERGLSSNSLSRRSFTLRSVWVSKGVALTHVGLQLPIYIKMRAIYAISEHELTNVKCEFGTWFWYPPGTCRWSQTKPEMFM